MEETEEFVEQDYVVLLAGLALRDGGTTRLPMSVLESVRGSSLVAVLYDREQDEVVIEVASAGEG